MNNPNPFLPEGSFLEQKNRARRRLNIAVYFSISLSVVVLMALLIQGCRKPSDAGDTAGTDTNTAVAQLPTNPPDMGTASNTTTPPPTSPPAYTPPPPPPAPPMPPVSATEDYTIVKGDLIANIATKNHITTKAILEANPGLDPKRLKIGQKIHLPAATSATTSMAPTTSGAMDTASTGGMQTYKVKSGDNLTTISTRFHVTIKAIQSANNLTTTSIKVGEVLKIPGAAAPAPAPTETLPPPSMSAPAPAGAPAAH
jgi:peptidoglycan endopeptidase LytE